MWPTCVPDGCFLILAPIQLLAALEIQQVWIYIPWAPRKLPLPPLPQCAVCCFWSRCKKRSTVLLKHRLTNYTVDLTKASPGKHLCLVIQPLFQACSRIHPHPQTPDTGQFWPLVVFRDETLQVLKKVFSSLNLYVLPVWSTSGAHAATLYPFLTVSCRDISTPQIKKW